jgi:hypothetical protein
MNRDKMLGKLDDLLPGLIIQWFKYVEGGILILYLGRGPVCKIEDPKSPIRLWIDSAWRICNHGRILAGSLDSHDFLMPQLQKLLGLAINSVRLGGIHGDIVLLLQSDITIESFTRSLEDEWQFRRSDGYRLGLKNHRELYEAQEEPDPESGITTKTTEPPDKVRPSRRCRHKDNKGKT